ncbi:MAG: DmsC/YnfH family molybdoenzyme membrane anchor subunit [Anaerolineales bacterium]|jgi:anaerobic dimethyl sulfoxide reductase subunit C (anchor subunit)|nr:DmsC/YnfH family molybdoenzyme membrane anchor subunit [Anaerolineales bacterium]
MDIREWSLLIFTILGQVSTGALIILLIVRTYAVRKAGLEQADRLTDKPLFIVVPIILLALLASLLHLGNPLNITRAVPNLGSSWLSREVIIVVIFVILAGIYTVMQWRKISSDSVRTVIGWVAAAVGLFQTYAMAQVYMIRTQPAWNTFATPITFITTSLLLGALLVAVALVATRSKDEIQLSLFRDALRGIALAAIVLVGVEFVVLPVYAIYLSTQGAAALESLGLMIGPLGGMFVLRLVFVFAGAGLLAFYMYKNASVVGREAVLANVVYSAFILVLLGETMGRYIFYATKVGIGL